MSYPTITVNEGITFTPTSRHPSGVFIGDYRYEGTLIAHAALYRPKEATSEEQ